MSDLRAWARRSAFEAKTVVASRFPRDLVSWHEDRDVLSFTGEDPASGHGNRRARKDREHGPRP